MTQTLRRSKSKYARTRRQHKKQRRIRGGGFLNDVGNTIVGAFKPSTDEEKCKELKEAAQRACSKVAEGDIEMMKMASDTDASSPVGEGTAEYGASSSTTPVGDRISSSTSSSIIPVGKGLSGSGEGLSGSDTVLSGSDTVLSSGSDTVLSSGSDKGGAKKSRRKNKKRSQSRRKKHKSRKHKK